MNFTPAPIDITNPVNVQRWVDETGKWHVAVERVAFGYRVQLHHTLDLWAAYPDVVLDYCAGPDATWVEALAHVLMQALRDVPPTMDGVQLHNAFPRYKVRPMYRDPTCWATLCRLARIDPATPVEDIGSLDFNTKRAIAIQIYLTQIHAGLSRDYAQETLNVMSSF